jgi:hypothetical protein
MGRQRAPGDGASLLIRVCFFFFSPTRDRQGSIPLPDLPDSTGQGIIIGFKRRDSLNNGCGHQDQDPIALCGVLAVRVAPAQGEAALR